MGGVADAEREAEGDGEIDLEVEVEGGARGSYLPHSISMESAESDERRGSLSHFTNTLVLADHYHKPLIERPLRAKARISCKR